MFLAATVAFFCLQSQESLREPDRMGTFDTAHYAATLPFSTGERKARISHPQQDGTFPAIIFSPGGQAKTVYGYEGFARRFASWGYVTVVVAFDSDTPEERARQYSETIDWLLKKNGEKDGPLKGRIDPAKIVACGHSRGGFASVLAAGKDKRFAACLALAPSGPGQPPKAHQPAWCFISGDQGDQKISGALYRNARGFRANVTIAGMDHFFQPQDKIAILHKYAVAFLNWKVRGDDRYRDYFVDAEGVKVTTKE